ncbi:hypothetical protein IGI04_019099 [Brassica rapa subsp. trilocularis]|uniref:Uncharacterized protein n=1 Tax=Brassica rapa subsp. trilocularis TaxID=1813537 RepID=A0ABQ7MH88_BRACM|nr:hypothetical protein IGI04_019099 [Brassica rapa subsp. trilocularis]
MSGGTTPREETPHEKTPRGAIPPTHLPLVVSPGPSTGPANVESSREDLTLISERETAEPSVTGGNKKRSAPDSSASAASQARTESDGPPKKKKKNERKKKKSVEEQSEPAEGAENREIVIEKGSVEPTGRELGESSLQEGGIVGEVARLEDTTVAPALDPTTLSTSLVVNEDPLVPVLGTGVVVLTSDLGVDETGTEPVNLLELSDSSTEEEGGEQLEETESGFVGNPQNEEGAVDGTDSLPVLPANVTREASDQLAAQVVEGGSDRVED